MRSFPHSSFDCWSVVVCHVTCAAGTITRLWALAQPQLAPRYIREIFSHQLVSTSFVPKTTPACCWKRKKEVWLGTLPGDACLFVNVCHLMVEMIIKVADDALWRPWNVMVSRLIRFPAIGFMSEELIALFSTTKMWRRISPSAPLSHPTLLFFNWTVGGAAKAKISAPSNPSVCWGCCVRWRPSSDCPN